MQALPQQLQNELGDSLKLNAEISQISKDGNNWAIKVNDGQSKPIKHSTVISTLPPRQLSNIWSESTSNREIDKLAEIEYAPVSVTALGFKRDQIDHALDGFGFLVPEKENFSILGCLFSSSLFANRAPDNHILLTCFFGGMRNPALAQQPTEKLTLKTMQDLDRLLGVKGEPVFKSHIYWSEAIPQFSIGYDEFLGAATKVEKAHPDFFIGGNFVFGVSVPDCILHSLKMAERIKCT